MINRYRAGSIVVEGKEYHRDLKIFDHAVHNNWWRKEGHSVDDEDLKDILSAKPAILVIGTGYAGQMQVSNSLRSTLSKEKIELIVEMTAEAVKTFNRLKSEGKNVAGAFHLTC